MQSSYDRDDYIKINKKNLKGGTEHNFKKMSKKVISYFGTSYDYDSVMHYNKRAFARNRAKLTIETMDPEDQGRIGQRIEMSPGDVERINNMYECKKKEAEQDKK